MDTNIKQIYVQLLDEGTTVWRLTTGIKINNSAYKILPTDNYDPKSEKWEFKPGDIVQCDKQVKEGRIILLAIKLCSLTS